MESFVYKWTNIENNMYYIGVHKGHVDDGYICSSKHMLEEYKNNPSVFKREILAEGTDRQMREYEKNILLELNAAKDILSYNKWNSHSKLYNVGPMSDKHKKKISIALRGNKNSKGIIRDENFRKKLSDNKKGNKNFLGKKHTKETKEKISLKQKGKTLSETHLNNIRIAQKKRREKERLLKIRGTNEQGSN